MGRMHWKEKQHRWRAYEHSASSSIPVTRSHMPAPHCRDPAIYRELIKESSCKPQTFWTLWWLWEVSRVLFSRSIPKPRSKQEFTIANSYAWLHANININVPRDVRTVILKYRRSIFFAGLSWPHPLHTSLEQGLSLVCFDCTALRVWHYISAE